MARILMPSKVNFGHPIWPIDQKWPEMLNGRRKKMAAEKKPIKFCIDLKWPELLSKVNFRHPKWPIDPPAAIL